MKILYKIWYKENFIALILIGIFVWFKFIRIRLPKDLPLLLSNKSFICFSFLIISLFFSLILLIINHLNIQIFKFKNNNNFIQNLKNIITEILYKFDQNMKKYLNIQWNVDIQQLYVNIFNYLRIHKSKIMYIYIIFMLPKIILPIILFIEIFYFYHINIFYKFIILLLLPLSYNYIYYSLHYFYIEQIEAIENVLDITVANNSYQNIILFENIKNASHYYIQEYTLDKLNIKKNINIFNVQLKNIYLYNRTEQEIETFYNSFCKNSFLSCIKIYEILYLYTMIEKKFSFYINFFITITYFICWFFVLKNANYCNITFDYLTYFLEEPFSGLTINDNFI